VLAAAGRADRYGAYDLARAIAPLVRAENAEQLAEMLGATLDSPRLVAATILSMHPEFGAGAQVRGALVTALQDSSSQVRARAAEALGRLRARAAVPSLTLLLSDYALEVRTAAIEALARIGDAESAATAASEARRYGRVDPRWFRALGLSGTERETAFLLKSSQADSWIEQRAALEALAFTARPEALARLLAVFRDARNPFQTHAGDALATPALSGSGLSPVATRALDALAPDMESERPSDRARALYWLARLPLSATADRLSRALADPEANIRQLADWILRRQTGQDASFDPQAPPGQREAAAKRWAEMLDTKRPRR
jgi:HEAT repeat protein